MKTPLNQRTVRAASAGGHQSSDISETNEGSDEKKFIRYGNGPETMARFANDAAAAESQIGIHGVSVILRKPPAGPRLEAIVRDARANFRITQTGRNKFHYTVELPKPVTQAVVDKFNSVFTFIPR